MPQTNQNKRGVWVPNSFGEKWSSYFPNGERARPPKPLTLTGAGFGVDGPNIVLFDRFTDGRNGEPIPATRIADVGAWKKIAWSQPAYYARNGRHWMAGRNIDNPASPAANIAGLMFSVSDYFQQLRYAHRLLVPTGFNFPGAPEPNTLPHNSTFKMSCLADIDASGNFIGLDDQDHSIHDLCFPTYVGTNQFTVTGNTTQPKYYDLNASVGNNFYLNYSHNQENFYCHYQDGPESAPGAHDKRMEGTWFQGDQLVGQYARSQCSPFRAPSGVQTNVGYRGLRVPGWFGSAANFINVLPLFSDIYLAIGPTSRACVWVTDNPVFANSTKGYLLPVFSWADGHIQANIADYENLGYFHVQPVNGNLIENVAGVIDNG